MSSNAACNSSVGKKVNRRYARENPTILTSVIREEDVESDDNYENEETSDSEDGHYRLDFTEINLIRRSWRRRLLE